MREWSAADGKAADAKAASSTQMQFAIALRTCSMDGASIIRQPCQQQCLVIIWHV